MNMPALPPVEQIAAQASQPAGGDGPDAVKLQEPGEFLYGVVTATKYGLSTQYGEADLIELVDQQRGPVALWCTNAQLRNGIVNGNNQAGRPVQVGDLVYVRFDGKQQLEGGKTLSLFSINVQASTGETRAATQSAQQAAQPSAVQPQAQPQQQAQGGWGSQPPAGTQQHPF